MFIGPPLGMLFFWACIKLGVFNWVEMLDFTEGCTCYKLNFAIFSLTRPAATSTPGRGAYWVPIFWSML